MTIQEKLFRSMDRTADWVGLRPRRLNIDELMAGALVRAGRSHFADGSFVAPLRRLVDAYETEADLSVFGRLAARFDIQRSLANILRFEAAEEANPHLVRRPISKPVIITGLPRSGTTFLHMLLAQDPANAVPESWQLVYPYPEDSRGPDRRRKRVEQQLRFFRKIALRLDGLHPVSADVPQECSEITAQVFQSLRFDTTHRIPSYLRWIDAYGHEAAFRFHRRFLQHLDVQNPGKQWILKCPDHVFTLDAVRSVYHDARIVMLHRDPVSVIGSVAELTDVLRRPFTRHVDKAGIGRQVAERWGDGADRMVGLRDNRRHGSVLHLRYHEFVRAPVETVERLYRHCGLTMTAEARLRLRRYLELSPRGGYREHRHSLADYGLDPTRLRERFAAYIDAYDLASNSDTARKPDRSAA